MNHPALPPLSPGHPPTVDADGTLELMQQRQTILPKRLMAPGPDEAQLNQMLAAAVSAPDHGQVRPWRFIRVPDRERPGLAEVFAQSLRERDPGATPDQIEMAREKAHRAPLLLLLVVDTVKADTGIDAHERLISAGCATQNLLLMATAMGFGSALTSGKALQSQGLRDHFGLQPGEVAPCFISVGTVARYKGRPWRPEPHRVMTTLCTPSTRPDTPP